MLPEGEDLDEWLSVYGNYNITFPESGEANAKMLCVQLWISIPR